MNREEMTDAADAFVLAKGNPDVELNGNTLRHWMADFALTQQSTAYQSGYDAGVQEAGEKLAVAREAGKWVTLDQWPASDDEFSGAYWSGLAYLKPAGWELSTVNYIELVYFDAGVGIWWQHSVPLGNDHDIDPTRIISLLYIPDPPEHDKAQEALKAMEGK